MDQIAKALRLAKSEIDTLKSEVQELRRPRAVPRDGKPGRDGLPGAAGRDGASPDMDKMVAHIIERMPGRIPGEQGEPGAPGEPGRDGTTPKPDAILERLTARIPEPIPGQAGQLGEPGAQGLAGPQGQRGEPGAKGEPGTDGEDGASITDVKLEGSQLVVWVDGVRQVVGTIKIPLGPFTPGTGGGGGSRSSGGGGGNSFTNMNDFLVTSVDTSSSPQSVEIPSALIAVDFNFFTIKDESNNASVNNITITMEGAETIDGSLTTVVVNADSGGLQLYSHNGNLFSW